MKHVFILLVNLTFVLRHFEFVVLSPGIQTWYIPNDVSPLTKVSLSPENYLEETCVYIILRIFTVPLMIPDYLTGTESENTNFFTTEAAIHYYVGRESKFKTKKAAVTYVAKLLETLSAAMINVKIFRESNDFGSTIFKNMFRLLSRITDHETQLLEITYDGSLHVRKVSPTFESLKENEVYVYFGHPYLFIFSKGTESSEATEMVQIKETAGKNIASLLIHNYENVDKQILLQETYTHHFSRQFFGLLGNYEKRVQDIKNKYNYDTYKITNAMEEGNQIHEFHENGDIVTHNRKLNTYEITQSKCYLFEHSEFLSGYVYIGQQCNIRQIEAVLKKAEKLTTKKFKVAVIEKEVLPTSFILLFPDIGDILISKEYNNSEELINEITTMLKLRP